MEKEELVQKTMQIILAAGDAQNLGKQALDYIADSKDEEARDLLNQSRDKINEAHAIHASFLKNVMDIEMNLLLVHALDHLTMAELINTMASKMLDIIQRRGK